MAARIPSCPDWSMHDLVDHVGRVHHWVIGIVGSRAQDRVPFSSQGPGPESDAECLAWFEEGAGELVELLGGVDPAEPVWNWFIGVSPVRYWMQRMAMETSIHRWDGQNAVGTPDPFDSEIAVAGIEEVVGLFLPSFPSTATQLSSDASMHLHCTDTEGEWLVRFGPDGASTTHEHAKGDVAVRGTASDLYLLLWNRVSAERCEVFGDASLLQRWADVVRI
jgi:uncharacterized protein (TIGR03083 family)